MIPNRHCFNVLMKPFSLFVIEVSEVIGKIIQVSMEIMFLDTHIVSKFVKTGQHVINQFTVIVCFFIPKKVFYNQNKWWPFQNDDHMFKPHWCKFFETVDLEPKDDPAYYWWQETFWEAMPAKMILILHLTIVDWFIRTNMEPAFSHCLIVNWFYENMELAFSQLSTGL